NFPGVFHGKRAEHQTVHQAEDGGVGPDAEGERQNSDGSEAWRFAQHAQAVANVLQEVYQPATTPHVSRHLLSERDTSKFVARSSLCMPPPKAIFHILACGQFQVALNFFVKFFIAPLTPPETKSHDPLSCFAGFKMPSIASVSRAHRERSAANCLRPDFVRR